MDTSLSTVAEAVRSSVVQVRPEGTGGAGVVLSRGRALVVVTNAHVARGSPGERIRVVTHHRVAYPALIERIDIGRDLALLALDVRPVNRPGDLSPATLGDAAVWRGYGVTN